MSLSAEDRLDISELLTRADAAATARDASAYLALFTHDAVLDGDQGTYGLAQVWGTEPPGTLHLTLNPVIDREPASSAAAVTRSVLLIVAPGPPPALVAAVRITQYLRRGADGWRITRRSVER